MTELILTPILPPYMIALLAVVVLVLIGFSFHHKALGKWYRLAGCVLLLVGLFNPMINSQNTRALKDIAFIFVDQSSSQTIGEREAQTQAAQEYLQTELAAHRNLEVRIVEIEADNREDRYGTRVVESFRQALSGIDKKRYGGSVLITDGQVHDAEDFADLPGPFHVMLTGGKNEIDRRIEIIDAPRYGLVDELVNLQIQVIDNGIPNPVAPAKVTFPDGTEVEFPVTGDAIRDVDYIPEYAGPGVLTFETEAIEDEISLVNNKSALSISGVRDRLRVLLVSGLPHQGQRTWRNILRSDPAVDLVHFTILRPSEKEDFTPLKELSLIAFPVRELFEDKLKDFDLLIFDRYFKRNVLSESYYRNIENYLRDGGAILVSAGPDFSGPLSIAQTPLGKLLPAKPSGMISQDRPFNVKRPEEGMRHPITAKIASNEEDWGRWIRLIESQKISGHTILQTDQQDPVLIVDRIDEGRLALLLSDHLWLWARGFDGGGPHNDLVRHLVHWLMKEPDLEEENLLIKAQDNAQLVIERQSIGEETDPVTLIRPDGSEEQIVLLPGENGKFTQTIDGKQPGIYTVSQGVFKSAVVVGSINPKEFIDPRASEENVASLVDGLGGGLQWMDEGLPKLKRIAAKAAPSGPGWFGFKRNNQEAVIGIKREALIPAWLMFGLALSLWVLAWWRESR